MSPFSAGMGQDRQCKWIHVEHEEHVKEGDDEEKDVDVGPRHRGHVVC